MALEKIKALFVLALMLGTVAGAAGWLYSRQSLFRLSEIIVESESPELRTQIRTGLLGELGRSLFSLSLPQIEREVRAFPEAGSVRVRRQWPNTILVEVTEKQALAMEFRPEGLVTLDAAGASIKKLSRARGLPVLRGFDQGQPQRQEALLWLSQLQVQEDQPEGLLFEHIDEVVWDAAAGLKVACSVLGLQVELGFEGFAQAWVRANKAQRAFRERGIVPAFLDASYARSVIGKSQSELQNSQIDLNLEELGHRRPDFRVEAR